AMEKLHHYQLVDTIKKVVAKKAPLLGICLGLQLLFERSDETDGVEGLSILKGEIVRIPDKVGLKIPHIGWNSLHLTKDSKLFKGLDQDSYVYFVHSYYLRAEYAEDVVATTDYSTTLDVAVEKENVYACQFHPEKSGDVGLMILKNFANIGKE
ncbi:MAG TPA: imidazole glycerol phosphate synthase subunit HisH, partial [Lachnospiraceae bacterium]|nr:imidazole glycerol phosphate synthase subunit HisH [Lachnospiraceae bacterium]